MSVEPLKDQCNKAIAAHASWKAKFKRLLEGTLDLDAATTRKCDVCDFGRWLAQSTTKTELGGAYAAIDAAHRQFHVVAAQVVDAHHAGNTAVIQSLLGLNGPFTRASSSLTGLIVAARDKR